MAKVEEFSPDVSIIKRVLVAAQEFPAETPSYWELVIAFGFKWLRIHNFLIAKQ